MAQGVDAIICLSVNDAFVMFQWGRKSVQQECVPVADGNGEFTRKMGMLVDKSNVGFGMRSWRYSMLVTMARLKRSLWSLSLAIIARPILSKSPMQTRCWPI